MFLDQKSEIFKKSEKSTFSKGVSPWFLWKNRMFSHWYFLGKLSQKRFFFDILDGRECFLDQKSEIFKKSEKSKFSKGVGPCFFSKIWIFSHGHFLDKLSKKSLVFYVLGRKECCLHQKSEVLKKSEKSKFVKGVSPWFLWKNRMFFHSYFLGKLSQKRLLFDILDRKECFSDQKSEVLKKFKKSKISKAVSPCFFFKNSNIFSWVLFGQINPKNFVFSCSG